MIGTKINTLQSDLKAIFFVIQLLITNMFIYLSVGQSLGRSVHWSDEILEIFKKTFNRGFIIAYTARSGFFILVFNVFNIVVFFIFLPASKVNQQTLPC